MTGDGFHKFHIARNAALAWMARTGMTVDPRFNYLQLNAYADELAHSLIKGQQGTRDEWVNGMRLVSGSIVDYVETRP